MTTVKIAELKDKLSEHLRAVEHGAEVLVTDRNRPIARIIPVPSNPASIQLAPPKVPFASVRKRRFGPARWIPASDALLAAERSVSPTRCGNGDRLKSRFERIDPGRSAARHRSSTHALGAPGCGRF